MLVCTRITIKVHDKWKRLSDFFSRKQKSEGRLKDVQSADYEYARDVCALFCLIRRTVQIGVIYLRRGIRNTAPNTEFNLIGFLDVQPPLPTHVRDYQVTRKQNV